MALGTATVTFDLADLLGTDFDSQRVRGWITTNVPGDTLIDTAAGQIRLGDAPLTINGDGTGEAVVWVPGVDGNPVSWQTTFHFDYPRLGNRTRATRSFGPYTITTSASLASLEEEQAIPPEYLTIITAQLEQYVADAEAAAAEAEAIAGVADFDDAMTVVDANAASDFRVQQDARLQARSEKGQANGYAPLGADAKVAATYLPSYVDDVVEAANFAALPGTGETGKIYVTLDTNKTYRWSGSAYVEISASPGTTDALTEGVANLYFTEARAKAAVLPTGGSTGQVLQKASGTNYDVAWGTNTGGTPIAHVSYAPSNTTLTASTTNADADATNLAVTFTVPASGQVDIYLEATSQIDSGTSAHMWSLREGTTNLAGSERMALFCNLSGNQIQTRVRMKIRRTGLTPGASLTYKWAHRKTGVATVALRLGASGTTEFTGSSAYHGAAMIEVYAA